MYKYLYWVLVALDILFSKVFGLIWINFVYWTREKARNRVYNYVLQNNIFVKRIKERNYQLIDGWWTCFNSQGMQKGAIKYKEVSKLEYYLWFWLVWKWLDDDSVHDTMDDHFLNEIIEGERFKWFPNFIVKYITKVRNSLKPQRINYFDNGDLLKPEFNFLCSNLWNIRNTAYNGNYFFQDMQEGDSRWFYIHIEFLEWHFGWLPFKYPNGEDNISHGGRFVWRKEDYEKYYNNGKE